jgi:hypothetical protein
LERNTKKSAYASKKVLTREKSARYSAYVSSDLFSYDLIGVGVIALLLMLNDMRIERNAREARMKQALRLWISEGDVYWTLEETGRYGK